MPREVLPVRWRPRRAWVLVALVVACVTSQRIYRAIDRGKSNAELDAVETARLEQRAVAWMAEHPERGCPTATDLAADRDGYIVGAGADRELGTADDVVGP